MKVGLSLIIGFAFGLFPFLIWRLILPMIMHSKKHSPSDQKNKIKKIILYGVLVSKFIILGVLLYLLVKLPWLNIYIFIIGLIIAPLFIIIYLLAKEYIIIKNT